MIPKLYSHNFLAQGLDIKSIVLATFGAVMDCSLSLLNQMNDLIKGY